MQTQLENPSSYVPRQDGKEGIGSYARKLAKAGLDLSADPRDVVYNHPMVGALLWFQVSCQQMCRANDRINASLPRP